MGIFIIVILLVVLITENNFFAFLNKLNKLKKTWLGRFLPTPVPFDDIGDGNPMPEKKEEKQETPTPTPQEVQRGKIGDYSTPTDTFTTIGVQEKMDNHKSFAWDINAPKPEKKKK